MVSARRPIATVSMAPLLEGLDVTWFVPEGEGAEYEHIARVGARPVETIEVPAPDHGFMLSAQRNAVLDWAFAEDRPAIMLNDDLTPTKRTPTGFTWTTDGESERPVTAAEGIEHVLNTMRAVEAKLGGCAPTTNKFFYKPDRPVGLAHFIMGQLMVVLPCDLRFDLDAGTKEDYDYTLQHLYTFGVVARVDGLLGNFKHFESRGGWGLQRTTEFDTEMARRLIAKWPDDVKPNARRGDHEVLMRWSGKRYEP